MEHSMLRVSFRASKILNMSMPCLAEVRTNASTTSSGKCEYATMFCPLKSIICLVFGQAFFRASSLSKGNSPKKRRPASIVAPPHVSRALKPMLSSIGHAGSIIEVGMRVAASDWCPSRSTVLLKTTGFVVAIFLCPSIPPIPRMEVAT